MPFKKNGKTDNASWNNSGRVNKQLFNRYKPVRDDSYLMIYFNLTEYRDPYISIGIYVSKVPKEEIDKAESVARYLGDRLEGKDFKGFIRSKGGNERRCFYFEDVERVSPDDVKFLMTHLVDIYIMMLILNFLSQMVLWLKKRLKMKALRYLF